MEEQKIKCAKFQGKEPVIEKITEDINQAQGREKLEWAKKLEAEVESLLTCKDYDSGSLECRGCRLISQARKRTAEIVIETLKLV